MSPPVAPPAQDPSAQRRAMLRLVLMLGIGVLAILFFFRTRDPMILVFGIGASVLVALMMRAQASRVPPSTGPPHGGLSWAAPPSSPVVVKVRCAACQALNDEHARFCQACGKPM